MQAIKKEKGITLLVLVITIIIMGIIATPIAINLSGLSNLNNLSKLQSDFKIINEAISVVSNDNTLEIGPVFSGTVDLGSQKNPSDGTVYYVINLDLLQQLYTNVSGVQMDPIYFGLNNSNINSNITTYQNNDIFIMNKDTHTVYYLSGQDSSGKYIGYENDGKIYYRF